MSCAKRVSVGPRTCVIAQFAHHSRKSDTEGPTARRRERRSGVRIPWAGPGSSKGPPSRRLLEGALEHSMELPSMSEGGGMEGGS